MSKPPVPVEDLDQFNQPDRRSAMKKQGATDAKRAAANDKPENEKAAKAKKSSKPAEDAKYTIGSTETVKRGFLLEFLKFFVKAKGTVDAAMLVKEFSGRQIDGKKITAERIHRYIAYSKNHGLIKVVK
jgi:hypothetical protein